MKIAVSVPDHARCWHELAIARLRAAGHDVSVSIVARPDWPPMTRFALALERRVTHRGQLSAPVRLSPQGDPTGSDLHLDLTGSAGDDAMRVAFNGHHDDHAVLEALAAGGLVSLAVLIDGKTYDRAEPMIDDRVFVVRGADDVFARAITLILRAVARYAAGERTTVPTSSSAGRSSFATSYLTAVVPRIVREALRRRNFRFAHWRVGYRLHDGPGVAETGELGSGWSVLPDDGTHFYADPFAFEYAGKQYIFVEDYPHATRKAVISVSTLDANGIARAPEVVLDEPFHLSYPQVFAEDGQIWMLPEASGSGGLILYRAEDFPRRWVRVATLIEGPVSDATLLRRDDGYWLIATDHDGGVGSTSDTMVVFHAPRLTGPWTPHRQNPIVIDRRRARPGGSVIESGGKLWLPVQDGTLGYGGGLGLSEIIRLDEEAVILGEPKPVSGTGDFPYPQIHTLNRDGRLEVIDGIAAVRKP